MPSTETDNSNLITPEQLELDATIPQCLDNQYVSDSTLHYMVENSLTYESPEIKKLREAEIHNEFIRSLIYSSQVIINRAFLRNNEFLYSYYKPDSPELSAFAELMCKRVIIPYLYRETSLGDKLEFDCQKAGDLATKVLLERVGDLPCVRLAVDNKSNEEKIAKLGSYFREYLSGLKSKDELLINNMASELFQCELQEDEWQTFLRNIDQFAKYVWEKGRSLSRNTIYKDWFIEDEGKKTDVSKGRFVKPPNDFPYLYQIKKIVDLRYNTNLPDMLGRYTFTPVGLPSRVALQDFYDNTDIPSEKIEKFVNESFTDIRRIFVANTQTAMNLPLLGELSIPDVVEIRQMPEWNTFKQSQQKILSNPLNILNELEQFQKDFDAFQKALSSWYNLKYKRNNTEKRYNSFITIALRVAGLTILSGIDFHGHNIVKISLSEAIDNIIPKTVKGYTIKLLVNIIDIGAMELDRDRSYSIELMHSNAELTREDVINIIKDIKSIEANNVANYGQLADQGKA